MQLMQIRPTEQVYVDQERLGLLYTQLGEVGAEDVVCRAMEELALGLSHCKRLHEGQDRAGLRKGDIVLQVCGIKVHDHAIAIQLIERRMVIGGAIELLVERKEDVSKRGGGMRLWRRPVAPGPILGLATE